MTRTIQQTMEQFDKQLDYIENHGTTTEYIWYHYAGSVYVHHVESDVTIRIDRTSLAFIRIVRNELPYEIKLR